MNNDNTVFSALEDAVSALVAAGAAIAEKYAQTPEQRMSIRRTIGAVVDELIDGLYPQAGEERDE